MVKMEIILKNIKIIIKQLFLCFVIYTISYILSSIFNIHVAYFYFALILLYYFLKRNNFFKI